MDGVAIPTWSRDGNWVFLSSVDVPRGEIYKVPLQGGDAKVVARANVAALIANAKESYDGKWLYFGLGDSNTEIHVVSSNGGADHSLDGMPQLTNITDWALARNGIYFIDRRIQAVAISFYEFSTKKVRQIVTLNKPPAVWGGLCLAPDGKWLAYSQVDDTPSDIMLVEHFQ